MDRMKSLAFLGSIVGIAILEWASPYLYHLLRGDVLVGPRGAEVQKLCVQVVVFRCGDRVDGVWSLLGEAHDLHPPLEAAAQAFIGGHSCLIHVPRSCRRLHRQRSLGCQGRLVRPCDFGQWQTSCHWHPCTSTAGLNNRPLGREGLVQ